jgi:hypothetical protein
MASEQPAYRFPCHYKIIEAWNKGSGPFEQVRELLPDRGKIASRKALKIEAAMFEGKRDQEKYKHLLGKKFGWCFEQMNDARKFLAHPFGLLEAEKDFTRRSYEVGQRRRGLPWVLVDKEYRFDTDEGSISLADLFHGRSQLLVYHFMFGPDYATGCPSCSMIADGFDRFVVHLANSDVTLWAVSRAPLPKFAALQASDGLEVPLGVLVQERFQLRLRRLLHRGAAAS